jgi:transposase
MAYRPDSTFAAVADRYGSLKRLERFLRDQRARHTSYESIAFTLAVHYGIQVSGSTVRRWCRERGLG